jgi:hypothetical protein
VSDGLPLVYQQRNNAHERAEDYLSKLRVAVEALQVIADASPVDDMDGSPDYAREALTKIGQLPGKKP